MNVSLDDLKQIIEKTKSILSEDDVEKLDGAVDTLALLTNELELKGASIRRLRRLIFGSSSEKMSDVFGTDDKDGSCKDGDSTKDDSKDPKSDEKNKSSEASSQDDKDKEKRQIALFFTGNKHAGENLEHVLSQRNADLCVPIQMCDGISANTAGDFETNLSNCNSHARRKFVEVADDYVKDAKHILGVFKEVYKNDDVTKKLNMSDDERLEYHVANSKPLLDDLKEWFAQQFEAKEIEPNGSLGVAIKYMTDRWKELTLFLKVPGAPIDNNSCERVIKKAILHRKNSMFFKTENGAYVGDLFMSIIHTCELESANPFEYMVSLAKHSQELSATPANWMPWNYKDNL